MSDDKEEIFRTMCQRHDLTYDYSDDGGVWRAGLASERAIKDFAKQLNPDKAKQIWNEIVDTKLVSDARENFYWKGM